MFRSFADILSEARGRGRNQRVAIVGGDKKVVLEAAVDMVKEGVGVPVIYGDRAKVEGFFGDFEAELVKKLEMVDVKDPVEAANAAVDDAVKGEIHTILKGSVETAVLMKAVLRKENGLKLSDESIVSDVLIYEDPLRPEGDKRLIGLSDGGIIPMPDVNQKIQIIKNAVAVFHKIGFEKPKVALISAIEKPTEKIPSTMDAAKIKEMHQKGEFDAEAYIDGPFAIDNVISKEAAEIKGIKSVMAGEADILIVPNIETGNVLGKLANYYGKAKNGHVIVGTKVPILITSRADTAETKLNSVALGVVVSLDN